MSPSLKTITVTNFRSIKGQITAPLDAPVVLMYGQNGTGKTSILSAIELALTGRVPSLERFDPYYASHLVHKQADKGHISATMDGVNGGSKSTEIVVEGKSIQGSHLVSGADARFYSERCYLAQATLSRLLEIYENKDVRRGGSPLTMFVNDLLGLNNLDALIDGLHDAGDVRRLRNGSPGYRDVRETIPIIQERINADTLALEHLDEEVEAVTQRLSRKIGGANVADAQQGGDVEEDSLLDTRQEDLELQRLSRLRLDISVARDQLDDNQSSIDPAERENAENAFASANMALKSWRTSAGVSLENLFERLRSVFSDLPSPDSIGPEHARTAALDLLDTELDRCLGMIARDAVDVENLAALEQELVRVRTREAALNEQIVRYSTEAGTLAQALSGMLNHIHSDECPVCGRDFSESSTEPLESHVSSRIAALTHSTGQLQSVMREQADAKQTLLVVERRREEMAARQLAAPMRVELKRRCASLEELKGALTDIVPDAVSGEQMIAAAVAASRRLNQLRSRDQRATTIRNTVVQFANELEIAAVEDGENLQAVIERVLAEVSKMETALAARSANRREVLELQKERQLTLIRRTAVTSAITENQEKLQRLKTSKDMADLRIRQVRDLVNRVRKTRTQIIRQVFNDTLNTVWRDLFVRLAPDEPFVPAFALPNVQTGPVEAILETHYRTDSKGGNPRAMLSSGNLNTAALTLFLALHLSVKPTLPWLVIDDPVQSMDEVHISQFAALLRTLSKEHGRQVILTVHEKPLFDYLALELNPAFQNDRLITIEIGRASNGETVLTYEPLIWKADTAIAA